MKLFAFLFLALLCSCDAPGRPFDGTTDDASSAPDSADVPQDASHDASVDG